MECLKVELREGRKGQIEKWGTFRCCVCKQTVEMKLFEGKRRKCCSRKCSAVLLSNKSDNEKNRGERLRGRRVTGTEKKRISINQPKECIGCGYWGRLTSGGCTTGDGPHGYGFCRYILIEGHSRGNVDCRKEGIYTTERKIDLEDEEL